MQSDGSDTLSQWVKAKKGSNGQDGPVHRRLPSSISSIEGWPVMSKDWKTILCRAAQLLLAQSALTLGDAQ